MRWILFDLSPGLDIMGLERENPTLTSLSKDQALDTVEHNDKGGDKGKHDVTLKVSQYLVDIIVLLITII